MRILFCAWAYFPSIAGGAEHQVQLQAEEFAKRGHKVTVVCPRRVATKSETLNGVTVCRLAFIDRRPFRRLTYLLRLFIHILVRVRKFDIVSVHLAGVQADVVAAASFGRRPLWIKVAAGGRLGEIQKMRLLGALTGNIGLRHAAGVQAISDEIASELVNVGVIPPRIFRVPNGVDCSAFSPALDGAKLSLRARLSLPPNDLLVLFVGRLSRQKGLHELLEAWHELRLSKASLILVGSTRTVDPANLTRLADNVRVRPWSSSIADYYRAADIFVLPSQVEGMSNALLEAMASGLPVIASRVGAAEAMICDGINGLLVKPNDTRELAGRLQFLLTHPELRQRLGASAIATVRRKYGIRAVVDRLEHEYSAIARV